jgi:hypothetical protein
MNAFNKYGTITNQGLIDARFSTYDLNYKAAYDIYMADKQGDKYALPAQVIHHQGQPTLVINEQIVATLPTDWTQFVSQVKARSPLQASAHIQWQDDKQQFRAIITIEEN